MKPQHAELDVVGGQSKNPIAGDQRSMSQNLRPGLATAALRIASEHVSVWRESYGAQQNDLQPATSQLRHELRQAAYAETFVGHRPPTLKPAERIRLSIPGDSSFFAFFLC
jgi:hypothetical protein